MNCSSVSLDGVGGPAGSTGRLLCRRTWPVVAMLLLIVPDGRSVAAEPERLTHDGLLKFAPVFTSGGEEIVFSVHNVPNRVSLKRLRLSDGVQELVHPEVMAHQFDATFSADGRYHAFALSSNSPQLVLVVQDKLDGKEWTFRPQGARSTVRTPRMTPDGRRVVFTLSSPGGQQIASVNLQGEDLQRLTESTGTNCWPAVSPDGKTIAFSSSRQGHFNIYMMNADGGDVRRISDSPRRDIRPSWSPDGKRIAFTSARDGNLEIYVMHADGTGVRRITDHPDRDDYATWHRDGRRLLTVAQRQGQHDLYLTEIP